MIVGVGTVLLCRFEQRELRLDHGVIRPADICPVLKDMQPGFLRMQIRQTLHFPVDMHVDIVSSIVQTVKQQLEQAEFVMGQDQICVFHTRCFKLRSASKALPTGAMRYHFQKRYIRGAGFHSSRISCGSESKTCHHARNWTVKSSQGLPPV